MSRVNIRITFFFCLAFYNLLPARSETYFQQEVSYTIRVQLDDRRHMLKCEEIIRYTNHSPDSLTDLYFHVWPDAYKNDGTVLANQFAKMGDNRFAVAKEEDFGIISGLSFHVDGKTSDWERLEDTSDVCIIHLKKPLVPGGSLLISTNFNVKIPSASLSRLGRIDQSYFITQWYPKPAVYDANGWNYFPYLDQGEFYSEFATFDVFITLPANYVVAATGELVGAENELAWLNEKAEKTRALTSFDKDMTFPESDSALKTLHYHAENVHDFAWFTDKRFHVLKDEVVLPSSGKKILAWSFFTNAEPVYWLRANEYTRDALTYFSGWVGDYPYSQFTCVDVTTANGEAMEYPMITTIGTYGDKFEFESAIQHEVGHSWFYSALGTNERRHAWMDEGLTQFLETRYIYTKYARDSTQQMEQAGIFGSRSNLKYNHRKLEYLMYWRGARSNTDQQPDLSSGFFSDINYSADVYRKTALSFDYLKSYLGDSVFDLCMKDYFSSWKFKHPMPEDLQKSFEKSSGRKLGWLFDDLIGSTRKIDYKVLSAKRSANGYSVKLKNTGSISSPVSLSAFKNGKLETTSWYEGFKGTGMVNFTCNNCDAIRIDGEERIPEPRRRNNTIRTRGIFKKIERLKLQVPVAEEDPSRSQLYLAPVAGWNSNNRWMFGGAVHNMTLIEKRFEYLVMPMYSLASEQLNGGGRLSYNQYLNSNSANKLNLSVGYSNYAFDYYHAPSISFVSHYLNFRKLSSTLSLSLLNRKQNPEESNYISFRHVFIEREGMRFSRPDPTAQVIGTLIKYEYMAYMLTYHAGNAIRYNPYHLQVNIGQVYDDVLANLEYKQTLSFSRQGRGLEFRFFAGFRGEPGEQKTSPNHPQIDTRIQISGQSGSDDYLFDEVFIGRSETKGILSQQFVANQGGLKVASLISSELWLASLNIKLAFPGKLPLYLFGDIGAYGIPQFSNASKPKLPFYDFGVEIRVIPGLLSVYCPLGYSGEIKDVYEANPGYDTYWKKIRFELNISKLNPFTLRDQIRF